jgi:hypothetical protein
MEADMAALGLTNDGQENINSSRDLFHEDQLICKSVMSTVKPSVELEIRQSMLDQRGSGLFLTNGLGSNHEIYRSNPLVTCVEKRDVCHYCLENCLNVWDATAQPKENKRCMGCHSARFCSKVNGSTILARE